eukprot:TRINITY_DN9972_c0_g1_i1.p1 TRINITY_DN9972_c0_g1~~TRINITY_DN9972_c0_g1_i1.p1  ORF type:complete len:457 (-),score=154.88 TRINITY_DN9972_c0_g1_i1:348-1718(-)
MAKAQTGSATYSFASAPKPVTARKKYREPGEDATLYRDLKETCITWDKRVHRGNTYGMYTQNAIKEALEMANKEHESPAPRRRRKVKEPSPFDMPLPEPERIPVDLTRHLVAAVVPVEVKVVEAQTDEFLPEPPPEQYQPQKTGIDAQTQIEPGELFNFDAEVEPILDVLVNKTIEQSIMEVEEEHELTRMTEFKGEWYERQATMMESWQQQVEEEWVLWREKEAIMKTKMAEKQREARVLLKIQAISAAKTHLTKLVPNALNELQPVAFPDQRALDIERSFLPGLFAKVQQQVRAITHCQQQVDEVIAGRVQASTEANRKGYEAHKAANQILQKKKLEELQIRQGKIRILVDDGSGNAVPVGPVQISTKDSIDEIQNRVYVWLQQNEPKIATAWPHGVVMMIGGQPVEVASQLFEAKSGQISMMPKEPPPPPPDEEVAEGGEDGEGEGGEAGAEA